MWNLGRLANCSRPLALAATSGLLIALGCSNQDGLGARYTVRGTVSYKGAPVPRGTINFMPDGAEGRPASGMIQNGSYSLTTLTPEDGAFPGKYKVLVASNDVDLSAAQEKSKAAGSAVALPQDYVAKAGKKAKNAVPDKYNTISGTPLTAEVKAQSNSIPFTLED